MLVRNPSCCYAPQVLLAVRRSGHDLSEIPTFLAFDWRFVCGPTVALGSSLLHGPIPSPEAMCAILALFPGCRKDLKGGRQRPRRRCLNRCVPIAPYITDVRQNLACVCCLGTNGPRVRSKTDDSYLSGWAWRRHAPPRTCFSLGTTHSPLFQIKRPS